MNHAIIFASFTDLEQLKPPSIAPMATRHKHAHAHAHAPLSLINTGAPVHASCWAGCRRLCAGASQTERPGAWGACSRMWVAWRAAPCPPAQGWMNACVWMEKA